MAGVNVRDLGVHRLKDLDRPEHVYQLVADGLEPSFPKIRTAGAQRPYYRRPLVIGATAGVLAAAVAIPVFALAGGSGGSVSALKGGVEDNAVGVVDESSGTLHDAGDRRRRAARSCGRRGRDLGLERRRERCRDRSADAHRQADDRRRRGARGLAVNGRDVWVADSLDNTVSQVSADTEHEVGALHGGKLADRGRRRPRLGLGDERRRRDDHAARRAGRSDRGHDRRPRPRARHRLRRRLALGHRPGRQRRHPRARLDSPSSTHPDRRRQRAVGDRVRRGRVWVANNLDGTVSRIDPASEQGDRDVPRRRRTERDRGHARARLGLGRGRRHARPRRPEERTPHEADRRSAAGPRASRPANGSVWVGVQAAGDAHRGGDLRARHTGLGLHRPALAYFPFTWDLLSVMNDGLVGFKRVGGIDGNTLVPDLAASLPQPSDNGRTYSFQLRRGSASRTARRWHPPTSGPRSSGCSALTGPTKEHKRDPSPRLDFYAGIVGAARCTGAPGGL